MLKVPWTDKVSNNEVLNRANTERSLIKVLYKRQMKFFGHVMRKEKFENLVTTGKIEGKRARGRQRGTFLGAMAQKIDNTKMNILRTTENREMWRDMVESANLARE